MNNIVLSRPHLDLSSPLAPRLGSASAYWRHLALTATGVGYSEECSWRWERSRRFRRSSSFDETNEQRRA